MNSLVRALPLSFALGSLLASCEGDPPTQSGLDASLDAISLDVSSPDASPDVAPVTPYREGEAGGCNGLAVNCSRTYDRVVIAATHNAFAYATGGPVRYTAPNQDRPVPDQLNAGVRGLGLRPCPYFGHDEREVGRVYVTHNSDLRGLLGTEPFEGILRNIKGFLDAHPREVLTLYLESTVSPSMVAGAFEAAGLTPRLFALDPSRGWPTLQEMIDADRRVVVFNDSRDVARPPWMHYLWDHLVDTDYNVTDPARFSCAFYRGRGTNAIYYLNQFVYQDAGSGVLLPSAANARLVNTSEAIVSRARRCLQETGRAASVVYVDWYGQGDVVSAVDSLNRELAGADGGG